MGFRKVFQTAMLVKPLRLAPLKAREWNVPMAIGCTDAEAAFESIPHRILVDGWLEAGTPVLLGAALNEGIGDAEAQVVLCGEAGEEGTEAQLLGGGRPGDNATPSHWNMTLVCIEQPFVASWSHRGFGFRYGRAELLFMAWADDFTIAAAGIDQLQLMLSELGSLLLAYGIRLKQSKSQWMANRYGWAHFGRNAYDMQAVLSAEFGEAMADGIRLDEMVNKIIARTARAFRQGDSREDARGTNDHEVGRDLVHDWSGDGMEHNRPAEECEGQEGTPELDAVRFDQAGSLIVLVACLGPDADAHTAVQQALSWAWHQWAKRHKQLCRRRVSLAKRLVGYYGSVGLAALHGLDGVPLTQAVLREVQAFDRRCLRCMTSMKKRIDEGWMQLRERQHRLLRKMFAKIGQTELVVRLLSKQHGWAGHVMRLEGTHLAAQWAMAGTKEDWA